MNAGLQYLPAAPWRHNIEAQDGQFQRTAELFPVIVAEKDGQTV
jgi:hypothetical protein